MKFKYLFLISYSGICQQEKSCVPIQWHYNLHLEMHEKDVILTPKISYSPLAITPKTRTEFMEELKTLNDPAQKIFYNFDDLLLLLLEQRAFDGDKKAIRCLITAAHVGTYLPLHKTFRWALGFQGIADDYIKKYAFIIAQNLINLFQHNKLPIHATYLLKLCQLDTYHRLNNPCSEAKIDQLMYNLAEDCRQKQHTDEEELIRLIGYIKIGGIFDEYHLGRINLEKKKYQRAADFWLAYAVHRRKNAGRVIPKLRKLIKDHHIPVHYQKYVDDIVIDLMQQKKSFFKRYTL